MKFPVNQDTAKHRNMLLKASGILKYFLGTDDEIDTLIKTKPNNVELVCYDQSLYEAIGSLKEYDGFNYHKLVKFLESVDIISYKDGFKMPRPILTDKRVDELRVEALKTKGGQPNPASHATSKAGPTSADHKPDSSGDRHK